MASAFTAALQSLTWSSFLTSCQVLTVTVLTFTSTWMIFHLVSAAEWSLLLLLSLLWALSQVSLFIVINLVLWSPITVQTIKMNPQSWITNTWMLNFGGLLKRRFKGFWPETVLKSSYHVFCLFFNFLAALGVRCYMGFLSVQFSRSVMSDSFHPMDCSTPGLPVHHQLAESTQTHVHWVGDAIQPSHHLSSPSPPTFPSIRVFSNESALCIRWPKYWSFSFSISPSQWIFRTDFL